MPEQQQTRASAVDPRSIVTQMQQAWTSAAAPWNPAAITALYCADAVFFGGRPGHSLGAQGIRAYFDSYVGLIESATLDMVEQQINVLSDDTIVAQGYGEFSFVLTGAKRTRSKLRTTWVLVHRDRWQILLHHFSPTPDVPPLGIDPNSR